MTKNEINVAIKNYEKAIQLWPHKSLYFNEAGMVYARLGKMDKARDYLEKAMLINPNDYGILQNLGDAYRFMNLRAKSFDVSRKMLKIQAEKKAPMSHLALARQIEIVHEFPVNVVIHYMKHACEILSGWPGSE